ncbi:hypothetical protein BDV33DRAFT_230503 [Aspergillus novoparasiticus]|uniref:Uncharacterized protein n=1 Tax=Aspergillus novoparasiticus TaxID=986946 RepID=A0A5N6E676_9EURO|nr:hypothetical protein BDV33DRAFT_230503 [Aspergillus novoparasiticus]
MMDCLASILGAIKHWLGLTRRSVQRDKVRKSRLHWRTDSLMIVQVIIFIGAERGPDDLVITFLRDCFSDRLTWTEFKSLGPPAMAAVVQAKWRCVTLDQIAESIRAGRFDEKELEKLRDEAKEWRRRVSVRKPSDPVSIFERD